MSEHGQPEGEAALPATGLTRFAGRIEAAYRPIYTWLGYIGAGVLGALVLVMFYAILARRFFNAPLKGVTELQQLALVAMTFTVLGVEHMGHEKMTVDVIIRRFPEKAQAVIAPIVYLLSIGILAVACWQLVVLANTYREAGQTTRNLDVVLYPFTYLAAFGIFTLVPIYVVRFLRSLGAVVKK